jgi:hypothetical protein
MTRRALIRGSYGPYFPILWQDKNGSNGSKVSFGADGLMFAAGGSGSRIRHIIPQLGRVRKLCIADIAV